MCAAHRVKRRRPPTMATGTRRQVDALDDNDRPEGFGVDGEGLSEITPKAARPVKTPAFLGTLG